MKTKTKISQKILRIALITCSSLFVNGCLTTSPTIENWPLPPKPQAWSVNFQKIDNGYRISEEDAIKLANSVDELKAYIKKLEILIEKMKGYYK